MTQTHKFGLISINYESKNNGDKNCWAMITIMIIYSVNIIIFYQLINNHLSNGYIYIKLSNSKTDDSQNGAVVNRYNYPYISGRSSLR